MLLGKASLQSVSRRRAARNRGGCRRCAARQKAPYQAPVTATRYTMLSVWQSGRCLTLRSTRAPTAGRACPAWATSLILPASSCPASRRARVNSNVRPGREMHPSILNTARPRGLACQTPPRCRCTQGICFSQRHEQPLMLMSRHHRTGGLLPTERTQVHRSASFVVEALLLARSHHLRSAHGQRHEHLRSCLRPLHRAGHALRSGSRPNRSVKASPNSYACKARLGQIHHRPCRALHAPLSGPPYLQR